ncbi:type III secretion protein [Yersinia canariae]|uniref:Type III secretion protein n=1 Tax=Yersinia canariae TaxID=2607663 RepID=A0A857F3B6_9GAMM|nr:type III secretion system translocon subunit SctE [Yersinia canariae]QHB33871.1 type III secretion protein [Yersinia canariae]
MVDITQASCERINSIHTFTQGVNINQIRDDSTKNLLALEDACRELASTEQERRHRHEGEPQLAKPKMTLAQASSGAAVYQQPAEENVSARMYAKANSNTPSKSSGFNATASLIGSMATLRQLLHDGNLSELRGRLQMINAESTSLRAQGEKLLSELEKGTGELQNVNDKATECEQAFLQSKAAVKALTQQMQSTQEQRVDTNKQLTQVQQNLSQATSDLKALSTPTPTPAPTPTSAQTPEQQQQHQLLTETIRALTSKQNALQASSQQLSNNLTVLDGKLEAAQFNTVQANNNYKQMLSQATVIAQQADNNRKEINSFIENSTRPPQIEGERWESSLAILTLLTAQLKKALNDDSIKNMRQQQEVMETISEASRKDSEKKAEEAEEAQRKADEANKAASCASKVFGYIMLAVSVVATVASFGTAAPLTLAIAAIGIAMTVADIVLQETGNSSLMQMLATEISSGITDMLIQFGVPEEKAKEIGNIMGMVLAAVAFLAISLFSISSFVKNAGQVVAKVAKNASQHVANLMKSAVKALPREFVNSMGKVGSKATNLSKPLAKIADKTDDVAKAADKASNVGKVTNVTARKVEMGLNGTNMALGVTNTAVSGGLNLHASSLIGDMKEMLAHMMLNNAVIQAIDELLKALIKTMSKSYDQINEMFEGMISALNESGNAKANMMKSSFA